MKITKRQLKQIIKEERAKLVNEAPQSHAARRRANYDKVVDEIMNIMQMMDRMDAAELEELRDIRQSSHWANETVSKLARAVLLSRADSVYMGG